MKILVDELPKKESMCPFNIASHCQGISFCKCDNIVCDLGGGCCRWLKPLDKPIKDDCK